MLHDASGSLSLKPAVRPLEVEFLQEEVTGLDFEAREVRTNEGALSYDYLILSPGSQTAFFGTPGAEENAMDIKGLQDALRVRNHIIDRFEEAERLRNTIVSLCKEQGFYEYYDPTTGFGHGSDLFSWTAALFLDLMLED